MLTWSQGLLGAPSSGVAMAEHLGTGTLVDPARDKVPRTLPMLPRHPDRDLCVLLGIRPKSALTPAEIANLLSGNTTSGRPVLGLADRRQSRSLADALGLEPGCLPDDAAMAAFAAGRRADGVPFPRHESASILKRLHAAYGISNRQEPTADQTANILAGRLADGSAARGRKLMHRMHNRPARVAYRDFTLAADKSVSIAWALGTAAERAIIFAAHLFAVEQTIAGIASVIGKVRLGDGGRRGSIVGATMNLAFTHFTARETRLKSDVQPGSMHLHTQVVFLNIVMLNDGRVGCLDLGAIQHRVHEFGSLYQAFLATELRRQGVDVVLDPHRGCALARAIPVPLIERFSARTAAGQVSLEKHLAERGIAPADLSPRRRIALLKQGVQGDPLSARRDDVADEAYWVKSAASYKIGSLVDPWSRTDLASEPDRIERAVNAAKLVIEHATRYVGPREAAARGLIASGITSMKEVDQVAARLGGYEDLAKPRAGAPGGLADKRDQGTAVLVEGGIERMLREAVVRQVSVLDAGGQATIVVNTRAEAREATRLARELRRQLGILAPALYSLGVEAEPGEPTRIDIGVGDIVTFSKPVNEQGRRGRVAAAGSPVVILAIDDEGLTVRNAKGRIATIGKKSIQTTPNDPVAISHGYALVAPASPAGTAVIVATTGSGTLGSSALGREHDQIVFGYDIETHDKERSLEVEDLWNAIASNLASSSASSVRDVGDALQRRAADVENLGAILLERAGTETVIFPPPPSGNIARLLNRLSILVATLRDRSVKRRGLMQTSNVDGGPTQPAPRVVERASSVAAAAPSRIVEDAEAPVLQARKTDETSLPKNLSHTAHERQSASSAKPSNQGFRALAARLVAGRASLLREVRDEELVGVASLWHEARPRLDPVPAPLVLRLLAIVESFRARLNQPTGIVTRRIILRSRRHGNGGRRAGFDDVVPFGPHDATELSIAEAAGIAADIPSAAPDTFNKAAGAADLIEHRQHLELPITPGPDQGHLLPAQSSRQANLVRRNEEPAVDLAVNDANSDLHGVLNLDANSELPGVEQRAEQLNDGVGNKPDAPAKAPVKRPRQRPRLPRSLPRRPDIER